MSKLSTICKYGRKIHFISTWLNFCSLGPNIGILIGLLILVISLVFYAINKPNEEVDVIKILGTVGINFGTLIFTLMIAFFSGFFETTAQNLYQITMFIIDKLLNLTIPYFYINSKPNLKEYVSKTIRKGFYRALDSIALFIADVINGTFNFLMLLKPSPRVYPTIE